MGKRPWDGVVPEEVRRFYEGSGFGRRVGFGQRPAVLVIDMQYIFVGDRPAPVAQSREEFPLSCGEAGWQAAARIQELLAVARERGVPIVYTLYERQPFERNLWRLKQSRAAAQSPTAGQWGLEVVKDIAPQEGDFVISKKRSSSFFGTTLLSYLNYLQVDTLIITGGTTSACVRSTVLDASQYNFHPIVVEECVFDRVEFIHAVNLYDIDTKFGDVVTLEEAKEYLRNLPVGR